MRRLKIAIAASLGAVALLLWNGAREAQSPAQVEAKATARLGEPSPRDSLAATVSAASPPQAKPHGTIHGSVRDKDGKPVAGARACAWCEYCDAGLIANRTYCADVGDGGHFALHELPPGKYRIVAEAGGHGLGVGNDGAVVRVGDDGTVDGDSDVTLPEEQATVAGVVEDALGGPLPMAEVRVVSTAATDAPGAGVGVMVNADANGAFQVSVPRGWVRIIAMAEGYAPADVSHAAPATGLVLKLVPSSGVRGRVVDANAAPVPNATVRAEDGSLRGQVTQADSAGQFVLTGLLPGTYGLKATTATGIGTYGAPVVVAIGEMVDGIVIPIAASVSLTGVFLAGDKPCADGSVAVFGAPSADDLDSPFFDMAATDSEGRIRFENLRPGTYRVELHCTGYPPQPGEPLVVGSAPLVDVAFHIDGGAGVQVAAVDERDAPVAGLPLQLTRLATGGMETAEPTVSTTRASSAWSSSGRPSRASAGPP